MPRKESEGQDELSHRGELAISKALSYFNIFSFNITGIESTSIGSFIDHVCMNCDFDIFNFQEFDNSIVFYDPGSELFHLICMSWHF